jgi:hypothetical protein
VLGAVLHGNGCCCVGEKISTLRGRRPLDKKQRGVGSHDVSIPAGKRSETAQRQKVLQKKWEFLDGQEMFILWGDNSELCSTNLF